MDTRMAERFDRIWHNARLATMRGNGPDLGEVERGVIAARDGRIVYAGAQADFPVDADAAERIDCEGRWITPGLCRRKNVLISFSTAMVDTMALAGSWFSTLSSSSAARRLPGSRASVKARLLPI